jgi:hypothetical protein
MMRLSSIGSYRCFVKGPLTIFNIEKFTIMETFRHRAGSPNLRERRQAIQRGDITLNNQDTVAFKAAAEIMARVGNDVDISLRRAVSQLYKERDRIINMGASLPDDRLPDARDAADRIDDGLRLLTPATGRRARAGNGRRLCAKSLSGLIVSRWPMRVGGMKCPSSAVMPR